MRATNQIEWKKSWMPAKYTAEANLLLTHILPFEVISNTFHVKLKFMCAMFISVQSFGLLLFFVFSVFKLDLFFGFCLCLLS